MKQGWDRGADGLEKTQTGHHDGRHGSWRSVHHGLQARALAFVLAGLRSVAEEGMTGVAEPTD